MLLGRFTILTGTLVAKFKLNSPGGYSPAQGPLNPMVVKEPTARLVGACTVPCCSACLPGDPATCATFDTGGLSTLLDSLTSSNILLHSEARPGSKGGVSNDSQSSAGNH